MKKKEKKEEPTDLFEHLSMSNSRHECVHMRTEILFEIEISIKIDFVILGDESTCITTDSEGHGSKKHFG